MLGLLYGGGVTAASWISACTDQGAGATDAAHAANDGPGPSPADGGPDGATGTDAAADLASDQAADAGVDAAAEAPPDAPRPGILSVPADDPDVTARELTYSSDAPVQAYLAVPNRVGTFAGLILIHDDRGLTDHIRDVARRLAKTGCVALAPDLASRAGGTGAVGPDRIKAVLAGTKIEQLLADLTAGFEALAREPSVGAGRNGVTGFGFGGTLALRFAAADARVRAAVPYYGATPDPAEVMKGTTAAIFCQYGATDEPVDATIAALERVMKEAGKTFEQRLYPGAGHGFNDDTGPGYDEAAAVAAWAVTVGWFDKNLG
jgi:carboxymethylenebutenolidase